MASDLDWLKALPRSVRSRFDGLGSYVNTIIEDEGLKKRLTRDDLQRIQMYAFVRSLDQFLRDGHDAAVRAVDAFADLGVTSIRIGSVEFSGRNTEVMRGARLSERLNETFEETDTGADLSREASLKSLVITLARRLAHERRVG